MHQAADFSVLYLIFMLVGLVFGALLGIFGTVIWHAKRRSAMSPDVSESMRAAAADALRENSNFFLQLADARLKQGENVIASRAEGLGALVKPVQDTMDKLALRLHDLEIKREGAYRELSALVAASGEVQKHLRHDTSQLLQALRAPSGRGRWGEMQLKRLLEMTGMSAHSSDFTEQATITGDNGNQRPDVIVNLPGNRCVIIDSKVPLAAWMDSLAAADEQNRAAALRLHAKHVRDHVRKLADKSYWAAIASSPEFVVLFLPGEHFLTATLEIDGEILDYSAERNVVIATPMTLIALLRTVALVWQHESVQDNVREIAELGAKLHGALGTFTELFQSLGSRIATSVEAYNKCVASFERNVLGRARRMAEYGAFTADKEKEIPVCEQIDVNLRSPQSVDLKQNYNYTTST